MPSFSSFLKRSKKATELEHNPPDPSVQAAATPINDENGKLLRRQSKRDFLRKLLSPKAARSESQASYRGNDPVKTQQVSESSSPELTTPMSNSNKPLPPPPRPGAEPGPPPKSPIKLDRIISPISVADIHMLFSGAPQFFARSEGLFTGPPKPSVAFPWDKDVHIRDLCDHCQSEDRAWGSVTAYPHITRDAANKKEAIMTDKEKQRAHFIPKCHERPNMLSMQGLERGTMGFSAALEMGVADVLDELAEAPGSPSLGSLVERRSDFLKKKHGVRPLAQDDVLNKLAEIGEFYHESPVSPDKSSVEWYTELFTQVLFPPSRVTDSNDPYSLHVQIEALIDVLAAPNIWIDFRLVEWRIRLGQILWGSSHELDAENDMSANVEVHDSAMQITQRSWLLLQILLSCELLIRLDFVTKRAQHDSNMITAAEVRRFEEDANQSIRWSLILARLWLENIRIESHHPTATEEKKASGGWLAALTGGVAASSREAHVSKSSFADFQGRHQSCQISGLLHFARKLHWPLVDKVGIKLSQNASILAETTPSTPAVATPLSITTPHSSYFANTARPIARRGLSKLQQKRRSAIVQPAGWLSRSYLTGLFLPGEGLSHFLISTLLENDEAAVARLGDEANLYGGFQYSFKSYWSTACVVGRVLAAGKGASECMGWLSSDVLPKGMADSWFNIEIEPAPKTDGDTGLEKARIWNKHVIERDGHVLGDGNAATALPGDFTLPFDDPQDNDKLEVALSSLELFAAVHSVQNTPTSENPTPITDMVETGGIRSCTALMTFAVDSTSGGSRNMTFDLSYDVHFVTAHPCISSPNRSILDSSSALDSQNPNAGSPLRKANLGLHDLHAGHPLHKSFIYKRECLSQILNPPKVSNSGPRPLASLHTPSYEVFVIDCNEPNPPSHSTAEAYMMSADGMARRRRWGSDLEMLARAWCAEMGYNALISRRGRNCIACSIREARALGWKIVLRFG